VSSDIGVIIGVLERPADGVTIVRNLCRPSCNGKSVAYGISHENSLR
jgi:hypothetical protein